MRTSVSVLATVWAVALAVVLPSADAQNQSPWRSIRPSDSSAIKAALARLHAPQGFPRGTVRCPFLVKGFENICFARPTSIPLSRAETTRLITGSGAQPMPWLAIAPNCSLVNVHYDRPGLHPEFCAEAGTAGPLLLDVYINSVVRQTATSVVRATASLGPFPGGTQIHIVAAAIHR